MQGSAEVSPRALIRNMLYVNARQLWEIVSRLVLTPFILAKIGLEGYGTWALVVGLTTYVTMLNVSFSAAYTKLTAEFERRREYKRLSAALGSGMVTVGSTGALGLLGLWFIAPTVLPWLGVPPEAVAVACQAFLIVCAAMAIDLSAGCALYVLDGLQRIDLRTQLNIAGSIFDFGIALTLLYAEWGLLALALGLLAGRILAVAGAWVLVRRNCPALVLSSLRVNRGGLRDVISLGARFQVLALLSTAGVQAMRMAISALYGVALLGAYHLGSRLLSLATTPASSVIWPLLPAFAHLEAGGDVARWQTLFWRASKALAVAAVVALGFAALFADPLIFAWTDQHIPEAVFTVQVMAAANFAALLTGAGTAALRAAGTIRLELAYGLLALTCGLVGMVPAHFLAGFHGVVVNLGASAAIGAIWFQWKFTRQRGLSIRSYLGSTLLLPVATLAPVVVAVGIGSRWLPLVTFDSESRWVVLASCVATAGLCVLACTAVVWAWVLSSDERAALRRLISLRPGSDVAHV